MTRWPMVASLIAAAMKGNADAVAELREIEECDRGRRRIAAIMRRAMVLDTEREAASCPAHPDPDPGAHGPRCGCERPMAREAVVALDVPAGVLLTDGRLLREDWLADPQREADAISSCCAAWGVGVSGDRYTARPYRCGSPRCTVCMRVRAQRQTARWLPVLGHLLSALGYQAGHMTLTQPVGDIAGRPVLLRAGERRRWTADWLVPDMVPDDSGDLVAIGHDVPGEPLTAALDRLREAWTLLRDGSGSKRWWRETTLGTLYAVEYTGTGRLADGTKVPRWHVHLHVLVIWRPGVELVWHQVPRHRRDAAGRWVVVGHREVGHQQERGRLVKGVRRVVASQLDAGGWWATMLDHWCRVCPGASPAAQSLVRIPSEDPEALKGALTEVLKYPFKPLELSEGQLLAALAQTKGRRFHLPTGAFHGTSRIGAAVGRILVGDEAAADGLSPRDALAARDLAAAYRVAEEAPTRWRAVWVSVDAVAHAPWVAMARQRRTAVRGEDGLRVPLLHSDLRALAGVVPLLEVAIRDPSTGGWATWRAPPGLVLQQVEAWQPHEDSKAA